jgi:two-component system CheB/CheR fusion protein
MKEPNQPSQSTPEELEKPQAEEGQATPQPPEATGPPPKLSVVGMGASAGGLRALQTLFHALPADTGMTFVVVVHLSPEHESMMAELLQSHTEMPVRQVTERVEMRANHVYVIPPAKRLVVTEGHLDLTDFDMPRGKRLQIDTFFRSLAEHHGDGAAIILSGTGSDGSVGIQSIKEGGGLILVQEPKEAEYDGMPTSAIATGLADWVLPPAEMPQELIRYAKATTGSNARTATAVRRRDSGTLDEIVAILHARVGEDFSQYKKNTLNRRLQRRMIVHRIDDLSDYAKFLQQDDREVEILFKELLIRVTRFFRDPEAFSTIRDGVLPGLLAGEHDRSSVRAWVPACSSGEEA